MGIFDDSMDKSKIEIIGVDKKSIDDLIGAYNAAMDYIGRPMKRCGKCGGFVVDGYICPKCGNDPDECGETVKIDVRRRF